MKLQSNGRMNRLISEYLNIKPQSGRLGGYWVVPGIVPTQHPPSPPRVHLPPAPRAHACGHPAVMFPGEYGRGAQIRSSTHFQTTLVAHAGVDRGL